MIRRVTRKRFSSAWTRPVAVLARLPISFFAAWVFGFAAFARTELVNLYSIRDWGEAQGVDLALVTAAAQTADGYLWFGSPAGLFRFNGQNFRQFDLSELRSEEIALHVTALLADRAGGLWIGSLADGLFHYKDGRFTAYGAAHGLTNARVKCLFQDAVGTVWVGTDGGGAFHSVGDRFERLQRDGQEGRMHPTAFTEDTLGRLWMGTYADGILIWRGRQVEKGLAPLPGVKAMLTDRQGRIWVGTSSGLVQIVNEKPQRIPLLQSHGNVKTNVLVTCLTEDKRGVLWVGTMTGLVRLHDGQQEFLGPEDGLSNGLVTNLLSDREGNVWVGTEIGDLHQLRLQKIKIVAPFTGGLQAVNALAVGSHGWLWVGGMRGLAALQNFRPVASPDAGGVGEQEVAALGEDPAGRLWFANRLGDWGYLHNRVVTKISAEKLRSTLRIANFFFRTRSGQFRAGTQGGLLRIGADDSLAEFEGEKMSQPMVVCACEDREGTMWVGTGHGLNRIRDGKVEAFIDLKPRPMQVVFALHADEEGMLWIGTQGGLWRFRDGQFFAFGREHGAPAAVGQIVEDEGGHLWLGLGERVGRFAKAELNAVAEGRARRAEARYYGRSDGLRSVIISGYHAACKTPDGLICFATDKGVAVVNPAELPANETPPPVRIEQVVVNGKPRDWSVVATNSEASGKIVLAPGYNRLEIHYAALSYSTPERVQFAYRLKGLNEAWENAGAQRVAFLRALPAGEYNFEVAAKNEAGIPSPEPARLRIVALAPWWQTVQFKAGSAMAVLAALGGLFSLRVRRLKQLNETRREFSKRLLDHQETERRRVAKELHDGLGQDLLIIKNQVAMLERALPVSRNDLRERAQEINLASQRAVEDVRVIAYNLRPADLDRVGLTCSIEAMIDRAAGSSATHFDYDIQNIDGALTKEDEVVLYRIAQELVNNILKHSGAKRAVFDLHRTEGGSIELTVSDNGKGFDVAAIGDRSGAARGLGLDSVGERVAILKGELAVDSKMGQGTRFVLRVRVRGQA